MPEITATSDGRISILFTDNDYNIRLVTAKADLSSHTVEITSSDFVTFNTYPYAISYIQNGLLAITFADNNNQTSTSMINTIIGHEVFENGKLIRVDLHESVTIPTSSTINYLDIDSWHVFAENNTEMILAYITEDESDGLSILNINYNEARDTLVIGPRILNKNSGTSDIDTHGIHHLAILMLKSRKFIVSYSMYYYDKGLLLEYSDKWFYSAAGGISFSCIRTGYRRTSVHYFTRCVNYCSDMMIVLL